MSYLRKLIGVTMMELINDNARVPAELGELLVQQGLVDRPLADLVDDGVFGIQAEVADSSDLEQDSYLFRSVGHEVWTTNLVGILKVGERQIRIGSRFYDAQGNEDYFLRYLMQRVGHFNLTTDFVDSQADADGYQELMWLLFPLYLNRALDRGVYKEYVQRRYNDLNVRGPIDVNQQLKQNVPFRGRIAYQTREFSYDNPVTELIRHAVEKISELNRFSSMKLGDDLLTIVNDTPTYSGRDRATVLDWNLRHPIKHGYYEAYYPLQQLCIKILQDEALSFETNDTQVNGIIVDVAWLWEEYVNTLVERQFVHAENKLKRGGISLYRDWNHVVYPDFYSRERGVVLDAKYKDLDSSDREMRREDLYQLIAYLHVLDARRTGVIYPSRVTSQYYSVGELAGLGGAVFKVGLRVPDGVDGYGEFCERMRVEEGWLWEFESD